MDNRRADGLCIGRNRPLPKSFHTAIEVRTLSRIVDCRITSTGRAKNNDKQASHLKAPGA